MKPDGSAHFDTHTDVRREVWVLAVDGSVRKSTTALLESQLIPAREFSEAEQLVSALRSAGPGLDLSLIVDPYNLKMTQDDLYAEIRGVNANVPIIFTAGQSCAPLPQEDSSVSILLRPYPAKDLFEALDRFAGKTKKEGVPGHRAALRVVE